MNQWRAGDTHKAFNTSTNDINRLNMTLFSNAFNINRMHIIELTMSSLVDREQNRKNLFTELLQNVQILFGLILCTGRSTALAEDVQERQLGVDKEREQYLIYVNILTVISLVLEFLLLVVVVVLVFIVGIMYVYILFKGDF